MVIGGIGEQEPGSGKCLRKQNGKNIKKYSAYEFEIEGNLLMKEHKKSGITCSIFIYITQKRNNKVSLEIQLQFPSPNNLCKEK